MLAQTFAPTGCSPTRQATSDGAAKPAVPASAEAARADAGSKTDAGAKAGEPAFDPPPESGIGRGDAPPAVPSLRLEKLPFARAVERLTERHYDPARLGLKTLRFRLALRSVKDQTDATAEGYVRVGSAPDVRVHRILRQGKPTDATSEVGQLIWKGMRFQLRRLLEGLGSGFLAERLAQWKGVAGESALSDGHLRLTIQEPSGKTEILVGPAWQVEKVTHVASQGVTRTMSYTTRLEGGRSLVTGAVMGVMIDPSSTLPKRGKAMLRFADQSRFEVQYAKVGRYLLPVRLRKSVPSRHDEVEVTLTYTTVQP